MEKHNVAYQGGRSRMHPDRAVDCMSVDVDGVELYAELENPTWNEELERFDDETATYDELRAVILEQAAERGIPAEALQFFYD